MSGNKVWRSAKALGRNVAAFKCGFGFISENAKS
jgi:hypothetical protein